MKTRTNYFKRLIHIALSIAMVLWAVAPGISSFVPTAHAVAVPKIPAERLPMLDTLPGVTLTSTLGNVAILNGLPLAVTNASSPTLFVTLGAQHPGAGSDANSRYVGFMINPPVIAGYEWTSDSLKETTPGNGHDFGSENRGDTGTHDNGTELWETVAVKSGDVYNREFRTPKNYEIIMGT